MILNSITWNVDPEIFKIGPISIRYYGLLFASAFLFAYYIFKKYLATEKISTQLLDELLIYTAIGGVVGARLGHCFFYEPEYYLKNPWEILKVWHGGLASHGGSIGLLLAIWLYVRKHKFSFLWLTDRIAIVVALGVSFIRLGNLFNSEIYGFPTSLPWGFEFVRDQLYDSTTGMLLPTVPRHPTQIYEALSYFLVFLGLLFIYRKRYKELRDGYFFGLALILLFSARFLIEFLKNDQVAFEAAMKFNMGQVLSLPFILAGVIILLWTKKHPRYFSQEPVVKAASKKTKIA